MTKIPFTFSGKNKTRENSLYLFNVLCECVRLVLFLLLLLLYIIK